MYVCRFFLLGHPVLCFTFSVLNKDAVLTVFFIANATWVSEKEENFCQSYRLIFCLIAN